MELNPSPRTIGNEYWEASLFALKKYVYSHRRVLEKSLPLSPFIRSSFFYMNIHSVPEQETIQRLSNDEEIIRQKLVTWLRDPDNGWQAFLEYEAIRQSLQRACEASSLVISVEDYANSLFLALSDFNYAEEWANSIERGGFNNRYGEWTEITNAIQWLACLFRGLLHNVAFMSSWYGEDFNIRINLTDFEGSKSDKTEEDTDFGEKEDKTSPLSEGIENDSSKPMDDDDLNRQQAEKILSLIGKKPRIGIKYKELIERYMIKHDDLRVIAADFLSKGWTTTSNKTDEIEQVAATLQNRTVPKAKKLFDQIAKELGYDSHLVHVRRTKPNTKRKRKTRT